MKLEDEKILQRWRTKNQLRNTTYDMYKSVISHYVHVTGMSISELYNEAITEEDQHIPRYRKSINNHILDYHNYLEQSNLSENTKSIHIYIIKSFYKFMDIDLPMINNKYDKQPEPENTEKMLTKEIIQLMIQNARTRDKAIISFAATTGQAANEIRNLRLQQLVDCYNSELEEKIFTVDDFFKYRDEILSLQAPILQMKREKTLNRYWIYLPHETSKYILDYLHERVNGNNPKIQIHDFKDFLFVSKTGGQFSRTAVGKVFTEVGRRCGFEEPEHFDDELRLLLTRTEGQHRVWKAHNFRKYFISTCRRYAGTRLDSKTEFVFSGLELADFWVGHTPSGSIKHYLQYNESDVDEMKQQYLQVLPYLSLETEVVTVSTDDKKEFEEMKKNYQDVLDEMERLKEYLHSKQIVDSWE